MTSLGPWLEMPERDTVHPSERVGAKDRINSEMLLSPGRKALSREPRGNRTNRKVEERVLVILFEFLDPVTPGLL